NLFAVTVWTTSYDQLVDTLGPLADDGVRYLTPREAFACLPEPPATPTPPAEPTVPGDRPADAPAATPMATRPTYTG
ncbi:MAG: hypothetical protein KDA98_05950, partial [Acidimicrobiales bacterium]|nr:hypothetical protein [Acidimicrobiales bacterium]